MSDQSADAAEFLRETERRRLAALVRGDDQLARTLHADDYQLVSPGGATLSKEEYLGGIAAGELVYRVFEPASDIAVRLMGGAAAVRYQARIQIEFPGGTESGLFWHTDFNELREGRWQAVWSQATRIPPPRADQPRMSAER